MVVEFTNVYAFALSCISARERICKHLQFFISKFNLESLKYINELIQEYLVFIIRFSCLLYTVNELRPLGFNLSEELAEQLTALVLMQFLMQLAVLLVPLGWLPTLIMLTGINLILLWFILSEIQTLSRVNLTPYCQLEIFVGDLSVTVQVEFFEKVLELVICQVQAPVFEVES